MKNLIDEFVAFLEENNIKELYKKALIENGVINYLHFLEDSKPRNFICGAFSWSNTPEGHKFWQDVDLKWVTLLKELETPIKVGDKCIFWNDNPELVVVGRLDKIKLDKDLENPSFYQTGYLLFQNCEKYSEKRLTEIANNV